MMPLSAPDAQVIKLIRTPKLPESLFQNGQTVTVKVVSSEGNQATILLAGRQLATQTNILLSAGQVLTAQPMLINGQLQLKIIPQANTQAQSSTNLLTSAATQQPNPPMTQTLQESITSKTTLSHNSSASTLPSWTHSLPSTTQETLASLKNSLPNQLPLQQLLAMLNDQLQQANTGHKLINTAWQSLLNQALNLQTPLTAEKIQQSMQVFNDKYANKSPSEWKQAMVSLMNNPDSSAEDRFIAQQLFNRSELTQQLQSLQHASGHAVWLQEIPLSLKNTLDNFTLEIDLPKTEQPETEQHWKIFIQLTLPEGDFTSRIQLDREFNLRVQLWGNTSELVQKLQTQLPLLRKALAEQGLNIESLLLVEGKPEARTEKPLWQKPLVDCHG
jgi:hypothetical protein